MTFTLDTYRCRARSCAGVLGIACAIAVAALAPARAAPSDPLLARLDAASRGVDTLAGDFVQTSRIKLFRQELRSRGRFQFQRPRRVRWEYLDPDPSTLVLDGEKATLRTPDAAPQVFDLLHDATMRAVFDQIFLWFGAGSLEKAKADYDVVSGGTDAAPTLALTPRAGSPVAKAFARIELRFDARLLLSAILLREPGGDEKDIVFTKLTRNGKLPASAFTP